MITEPALTFVEKQLEPLYEHGYIENLKHRITPIGKTQYN